MKKKPLKTIDPELDIRITLDSKGNYNFQVNPNNDFIKILKKKGWKEFMCIAKFQAEDLQEPGDLFKI